MIGGKVDLRLHRPAAVASPTRSSSPPQAPRHSRRPRETESSTQLVKRRSPVPCGGLSPPARYPRAKCRMPTRPSAAHNHAAGNKHLNAREQRCSRRPCCTPVGEHSSSSTIWVDEQDSTIDPTCATKPMVPTEPTDERRREQSSSRWHSLAGKTPSHTSHALMLTGCS